MMEEDLFIICCVTGHRPKGFPFVREETDLIFTIYTGILYHEIENLINEGYTHFITGMAEGADMDFAKAVIDLRFKFNNISLEAALPYPLSVPKRKTPQSEERGGILLECDSKHMVSPYYHRGCMQKRNQYMVDKSDMVLAIWNGKNEGGTWNTIKYAQSVNKPIKYIMLNEIETEFFSQKDVSKREL